MPVPNVLIYAEPLLSPTMTFVRSQAMALRKFTPIFSGPRHLSCGLALPKDRIVAIREQRDSASLLARLKEVPFKVIGYDPFFFHRVKRFNPVLLHAHCGPAALTALPLGRWLGIPMVVTYHGSDATVAHEHIHHARYRVRVYAKQKARLCEGVALFLSVSKFIRGKLIDQGIPEDKIVVHYVGIDTSLFSPDSRVHREPIVLFVAALNEVKGCEHVIRAMKYVQSFMPNVELVIIGDGPLRPGLERLARRSLRRYRFLGVQPPEAVRLWMNRARVFSVASVTASSGATEGFGLVYIEAQSMGLPVASFDSGGTTEAIAHRETGLLAHEKDWRGLAQNILELLRNGPLWREMSEAGQRRARALFNLEAQTHELEKIYESVIYGPRRFSDADDRR